MDQGTVTIRRKSLTQFDHGQRLHNVEVFPFGHCLRALEIEDVLILQSWLKAIFPEEELGQSLLDSLANGKLLVKVAELIAPGSCRHFTDSGLIFSVMEQVPNRIISRLRHSSRLLATMGYEVPSLRLISSRNGTVIVV